MTQQNSCRYGIKIKKWCREYESSLLERLGSKPSGDEIKELLAIHEKRLSWLMHERLVHLIVTFITVILVIFSMSLVLFLPDSMIFSMPMFLILFVLLFFYIRHYFFLENTVQYWYMICQDMELALSSEPSSSEPSSSSSTM